MESTGALKTLRRQRHRTLLCFLPSEARISGLRTKEDPAQPSFPWRCKTGSGSSNGRPRLAAGSLWLGALPVFGGRGAEESGRSPSLARRMLLSSRGWGRHLGVVWLLAFLVAGEEGVRLPWQCWVVGKERIARKKELLLDALAGSDGFFGLLVSWGFFPPRREWGKRQRSSFCCCFPKYDADRANQIAKNYSARNLVMHRITRVFRSLHFRGFQVALFFSLLK